MVADAKKLLIFRSPLCNWLTIRHSLLGQIKGPLVSLTMDLQNAAGHSLGREGIGRHTEGDFFLIHTRVETIEQFCRTFITPL